jgi:hypothetical protein
VKYEIQCSIALNITGWLLVLDSFGCNLGSGTAKQMERSVQMFDLPHYDK